MKRECLTIIGTAHVSQESVEEVKNAIYEQQPEVVAIELDRERFERLMNEEAGIEEDDEISVTDIIKNNKVGLFVASGILTYIQAKIGDDLDVKPGSEMIAAIKAAQEVGSRIALIDRNINITLQRALNKMSWWEKAKFMFSAIFSLFASGDEVDVEDLKKQDVMEEAMKYFEDASPKAFEVLVKERDAYLAQEILEIPEDHVIAVVGAGHGPGITRYLDNPEDLPSKEELTDLSKKSFPWLKIVLALIPISFVVIFFLAFLKGIKIEWNLIEFLAIGCSAAFIGSLLSGSKIQSAIVGFLVAPVTIIHPLLAAGWFSGLTEAKYRKVRKRDIANLSKIHSLRDLWENNIFRILLVVIGTNLGVSVATLIILPSRVFIPLFLKLFGS
ncbi:TraB/GumN family protein [Methanobrevibacter filiformis]|uniref:TraB family protein n=1 Tax=Methanobrevibacter filiformis TaxID=55758 RepID=A0A166CUQ9_9EURY|nr:TraB/GumN family protein [Methanobrevibacter filiformis]KZX16967.1 TraB family protein [Methanobrevibacter filiformis]